MKKLLVVVVCCLLLTGVAAQAVSLAEMLPGDTMFFCHFNLAKLLQQKDIRESYLGVPGKTEGKAMDEFSRLTGFDPRKDLTEACLFLLPNDKAEKKRPPVGFLWRGKLSAKKLSQTWEKAKEAPKELAFGTWNGLITLDDAKAKTTLITFVDDHTGFVGEKVVLDRLLAFGKTKNPSLANDPEGKQFLKRAGTKSDIWGFGIVPQEYRTFAAKDPAKAPVLALLEGTLFSGEYDGNLKLEGKALVRKEFVKEVSRFHALTDALLAALKAPAQQIPGLKVLLDNLKLEKSKEGVRMLLSLSRKQLEALPPGLVPPQGK